MAHADPLGRLTTPERIGLVALAAVALVFGAETLRRSAFMERRMTDAEVFFRAGWAVRAGADIYEVTDTNGWHYLYPSIFSVVMAPLAVPPAGEAMGWTLPYAAAVGVWYLISLGLLVLALHWMAQAIEESGAGWGRGPPRTGSRAWWTLRVWPLLACLVAVGATLSRGQVAIILLALLARMTLEAVRGRGGRAGVWLAGAIALKVIPAFVLVVPGLRRDWRWLAGCGAGLVVLLVVLPALVFGPTRTMEYHAKWVDVMFRPALAAGATPADKSRWEEIHSFRRIDNQSPLSVMHHAAWAGTPLAERPERPARWTQVAHLGLVGVMTLTTALAAGFRFGRLRAEWAAKSTPLVVGAFVCVMLAATPVCQPDYFTLAIPAVAALIGASMARRSDAGISPASMACIGLYVLANLLPKFNGLEALKMYGMATAANIGLWALCVRELWRGTEFEIANGK
ncbi:MAG: glycosyltransferase family 87 protein [Phycisphaerales bacterium]